jgi:hypothetical protein
MKKEPVSASTLITALASAMLKNTLRNDASIASRNVRGSSFDGSTTQLHSFIHRRR